MPVSTVGMRVCVPSAGRARATVVKAIAACCRKRPDGIGRGKPSFSTLSRSWSLASPGLAEDRCRPSDGQSTRSRYELSVSTLASRAVTAQCDISSHPAFDIALHVQQRRTFSSSGGPTTGTRSSTTAAMDPSMGAASSGTNFSSKANDDENTDGEGDGKSRLNRGRAAAARGATVAKKGAVGVRDLFKKYGWTFVGTYFTIYWGTVGVLFAGIDSGLIDPGTVLGYIKSWGMSAVGDEPDAAAAAASAQDTASTVEMIASYLDSHEWTRGYSESVRSNPHTANFGLAWFSTKFTEPVRLGATLVLVPKVHRALGKKDPHDDEEEEDEVGLPSSDGETKSGTETRGESRRN